VGASVLGEVSVDVVDPSSLAHEATTSREQTRTEVSLGTGGLCQTGRPITQPS